MLARTLPLTLNRECMHAPAVLLSTIATSGPGCRPLANLEMHLYPAGQEAPAQQYRFLDVCAEELRGTFLTPAHSEQRLLYSESPWRLTVYDYSCPAHFLVGPCSAPPPVSAHGVCHAGLWCFPGQ